MFFPRVVFALSLLFSLLTPAAQAAEGWYSFFDRNFTVDHAGTAIQVGVLENRAARGTVIYMPGYADTIDNHETLLRAFRAQGLQVIAFDYPEHGQSGGSIRWWTLESLAGIIPSVLADQRSGFDSSLPVILAGWSTGATISMRIAQSWRAEALPEGTRLAGVIAYAPALPAKVVLKAPKDKITDGKMKRGPSPEDIPVIGKFATSITLQSRIAATMGFPEGVSALIVVGGQNDHFADSSAAVRWVRRQGEHVAGFQCLGSMHGFEFQPAFGAETQGLATRFAVSAIRGDISQVRESAGARCPQIRN